MKKVFLILLLTLMSLFSFSRSLTGTGLWSSGFSGDKNITSPVSELADEIYLLKIISSKKITINKLTKKTN